MLGNGPKLEAGRVLPSIGAGVLAGVTSTVGEVVGVGEAAVACGVGDTLGVDGVGDGVGGVEGTGVASGRTARPAAEVADAAL